MPLKLIAFKVNEELDRRLRAAAADSSISHVIREALLAQLPESKGDNSNAKSTTKPK